jgi:hypothetical protein
VSTMAPAMTAAARDVAFRILFLPAIPDYSLVGPRIPQAAAKANCL